MIIGIVGKKQVGKDTLAKWICSNHGFTRMGLADPIKEMISVMLDVPIDEMENQKESIEPITGKTFRYLFQTLGTEWGRDTVREDLWVKLLEKRAKQTKNVVISDIRLENEADFVRRNHGLIIHVFRETGLIDNHKSENGVAVVGGDEVIMNNNHVNHLYSEFEFIYYEHKRKFGA